MCMSILDRLFGGASTDAGRCCDVQIEDVDADGTGGDTPNERADRAED